MKALFKVIVVLWLGLSTLTARADTSGSDGLIEISGGGVVSLNQGGSTGLSDVNSFANFTGSWQVDSGTTLRGLRGGATAWGTGTITLNGGTLADGGMSGGTGGIENVRNTGEQGSLLYRPDSRTTLSARLFASEAMTGVNAAPQ